MSSLQELLQLSKTNTRDISSLSKILSLSNKIELSELTSIKNFNYEFHTSMKGIMGFKTSKITHLTTLFFKKPEKLNILLKNQYFKEALEQHDFISKNSKNNTYNHPVNLIEGTNKYKLIKVMIDNNVKFDIKYNLEINSIDNLKSLFKYAGINYMQALASSNEVEFNGKNSTTDIKPLISIIKEKENIKDTVFKLVKNSIDQIEIFSLENEKFKKFCLDIEYLKELMGNKEIRYTETNDNTIYFHSKLPNDLIEEAIHQNNTAYRLYLKKGITEVLFDNNQSDINIVPTQEEHNTQFKI